MRAVCHFLVWAAVAGLLDSNELGRVKRSSPPTRFFLLTRSNQLEPQELFTGDVQSITQSNFDTKNPTRIMIHGYNQSAKKTPNIKIQSAYLDIGEFNIISVDWKENAALEYMQSRYKVSEIGADVAAFVDFLNETAGMSLESLVVIGHSLGAHVAGYCGKFVTTGRLPYIVGLDPARPLLKSNERLNSSDADYVQTIQASGETIGTLKPVGSASFYANWGRHQPGCGLDLDGSCAHGRSVLYYADAVRGLKFSPVYRCASYTNIKHKRGCKAMDSSIDIGDPTQIVRENGIFQFTTAAEEPFGHE